MVNMESLYDAPNFPADGFLGFRSEDWSPGTCTSLVEPDILENYLEVNFSSNHLPLADPTLVSNFNALSQPYSQLDSVLPDIPPIPEISTTKKSTSETNYSVTLSGLRK